MTTESKVRKSKGKGVAPGCLVIFFLVFAIAGGAMFYFLTLKPILLLVDAQSWTAVGCVIDSSEVAVSSSSDGDTYRVDIRYNYVVDGLTYYGDRYDFSVGSSSGYDRKARIVDQYPPGSETTCYVDPDDPNRSVIDRSPGLYLLWGLFPIPFLAVGVGGLLFFLFSKKIRQPTEEKPALSQRAEPSRFEATRHEPSRHETWRQEPSSTGPTTLEASASPRGKFIGTTFIALFWNGIVSIFVYHLVSGYQSTGEIEGCMAIFLIPFVVIGLALIGGIFYTFLALFNPRPVLVLQDPRLEPGRTSRVSWKFDGKAGRMQSIKIRLEGREAATYRRGTSTSTDHHVFHDHVVVEESGLAMRTSGIATIEIPEGTMPSFESSNNKIEWRLIVEGDIPRWPDVKEELPVEIHPPAAGSSW